MTKSDKLLQKLRALSSPQHDARALVRLLRAAGLLFAIFLAGTFGYYYLCDGEYSLLLSAYMTIITLTSIGYGEAIPIQGHPDRMVFTIGLVITGMGMMLFFVSQLTAFIVDGELRDLLFTQTMKRQINKLDNHFIIAGMGNTGRYVLDEILASGKPCLVIERAESKLEEYLLELEKTYQRTIPFLIADATEDAALIEAGIERAVGIVFALGNDRDNLFATITARSINPDLRIITRGANPQSEEKFLRAGATSVIFTNVLGGMRMAAEVMRPEVTGFLDLMMRDHGHIRRIEELDVPRNSPLIGKTLRETNFRKCSDALIIATFDKNANDYTFNPGPNNVITAHTKLIVLTLVEDVPKLEALLCGKRV